MIRTGLVLLLALSWRGHAFAAPPPAQRPMTVQRIFHGQNLAARPPQGMVWSPDGSRLIYTGSAGDLMIVEGVSGAQKVLVDRDKMRILNEPGSSRYEEFRSRYHEPSYLWAPDSRNLLFDSHGQFWFFNVDAGIGVQVASTGDGTWGNPQFSPDGAYLSYIRDHNLYARRLQGGDLPMKLTGSSSEAILDGEVDWVYKEELGVRSNYFWSPDSRRLAYLQMDESRVPPYPIEDWLPAHAKVEAQRYPQPGDLNPAVRVGVVSANGGKTKWIRIPISNGEDYIPRFGWVDGRTLWIETLTRDQKTETVYFADIESNHVRQMLTRSDEKFLDDSYDVKIVAQNILLIGWQDGHNHIYLYRFDPANPLSAKAAFVKQLTGGDWEVSRIAGVDLAARTVYYLSNEGDPRQQRIWAIGMDGTGKHCVSSFGAWHDPVFSPNAKFFADTISSATAPPVAVLCRHETQCTTFWKSPPLGVKLIEPIDLELKASDGRTTLYGRLILSEGRSAAHSVPLILNPYGGPQAQTVTGQWRGAAFLFDQALARHGFAVLHVDNRGSGGRGREFAQAAFHDFGAVQLGDQMAALDQVLAKYPQLDPERLGWWGSSWGGTFTLYAMTHSARFRAGVAVAPVTDWRNYDSIYTERYMGDPAANSGLYSEYSVVESAGNLKGRLLLVQGTADDNVHFGNSIQFIQQLIAANIPYDMQIYPGASHSFSGVEELTHLYNRILRHFELYLMKPPGS